MPAEPPDQAARLLKLEEHAGFTEHTLDQLTAEMLELHKRLAAVVKRMDALEGRLLELKDAGEDAPPVEKPPHSAGPR
jgi:uncharacterized coiled-coil protein SlyX